MFTLDLIKEKLRLAYSQKDEAVMADDIMSIMDMCKATGNPHLLWFERLLSNHFEGIIAHSTYDISASNAPFRNILLLRVRYISIFNFSLFVRIPNSAKFR